MKKIIFFSMAWGFLNLAEHSFAASGYGGAGVMPDEYGERGRVISTNAVPVSAYSRFLDLNLICAYASAQLMKMEIFQSKQFLD